MAKTMARLSGDVVVNLEWCSDGCAENDELKDVGECAVSVGDIFRGGHFYHKDVTDGDDTGLALELLAEHEYRLCMAELGL